MWEGVEIQSKSQKNNQPTNQMKGKEKRTQNTHIYAQLSIILM